MRTKTFAVMVVVLSILVGASMSQAASHDTPVLEESEALNEASKWAELAGQANVAELEKLLSDKYVHIHATALVETKTQFLDAFRNGTRKYDPIKFEDLNCRGFGDFAIVTGKFRLKAHSRGKIIEGNNRFALVIAKTKKGTEVVSFQATAIPPQK